MEAIIVFSVSQEERVMRTRESHLLNEDDIWVCTVLVNWRLLLCAGEKSTEKWDYDDISRFVSSTVILTRSALYVCHDNDADSSDVMRWQGREVSVLRCGDGKGRVG